MSDPFITVFGSARGTTEVTDTDIMWERRGALLLTSDELWDKQEELFTQIRLGNPMRALAALDEGVRLFRCGPDDVNECVTVVLQEMTNLHVDGYSKYAAECNNVFTQALEFAHPLFDDKAIANAIAIEDNHQTMSALWRGSLTEYFGRRQEKMFEPILVQNLVCALSQRQGAICKDMKWYQGQKLPDCTWEKLVKRLLAGKKMQYGRFEYWGSHGVWQFKTLLVTDIENALKNHLIKPSTL